jgi:hypothetical protein
MSDQNLNFGWTNKFSLRTKPKTKEKALVLLRKSTSVPRTQPTPVVMSRDFGGV